jgi:hypothetical protein
MRLLRLVVVPFVIVVWLLGWVFGYQGEIHQTIHKAASTSKEPAHIIRLTNAIWWEDWWILQGHLDYAESHGLGGTYHSDIIPFMNMTFVHWSNGSMTIYPGTVPEAMEFYHYP